MFLENYENLGQVVNIQADKLYDFFHSINLVSNPDKISLINFALKNSKINKKTH